MDAAEDAAQGSAETEPGSEPLPAMNAASIDEAAPPAPEDPSMSAPAFPGKPTPKGARGCFCRPPLFLSAVGTRQLPALLKTLQLWLLSQLMQGDWFVLSFCRCHLTGAEIAGQRKYPKQERFHQMSPTWS